MSPDFILDSAAIAFAVFFMTSPLSQTIDVMSLPSKVKYVNPVNLICFYLNCTTQLAYGVFLPVPPVVPCNAYGVGVAVFSTAVCWFFACRDTHATHWNRSAALGTALALLLSLLIVAYAAVVPGGAVAVGNLGMLVGIIMYGAPLSSLKEVLRTESSETLPVLQSFLGFLNSSCWLTVGLRSGKLPVWGPNIIGMLLSLVQLALIYKYPAKPETSLEDDPVPPLKEHSLADIVRDATGDFADTMLETSHGLGSFVRKSSQNFSQFFVEKWDSRDYIPLDGEPAEEGVKGDKTKVIEDVAETREV
mmetsp:Transcript_35547/g.66225  ORF Transcript_35547/g.66225 Transcript_35547/m.66225 type:complete len:305 (+) Transcript_35547:97-1011(+)